MQQVLSTSSVHVELFQIIAGYRLVCVVLRLRRDQSHEHSSKNYRESMSNDGAASHILSARSATV